MTIGWNIINSYFSGFNAKLLFSRYDKFAVQHRYNEVLYLYDSVVLY